MSSNTAPEDLGLTAGGPAPAPETLSGLWVRATVNLHGAPRDSIHYVNPADPEVADRLRKDFLVPLPGQDAQALLHTLLPPDTANIHEPSEPDLHREPASD